MPRYTICRIIHGSTSDRRPIVLNIKLISPTTTDNVLEPFNPRGRRGRELTGILWAGVYLTSPCECLTISNRFRRLGIPSFIAPTHASIFLWLFSVSTLHRVFSVKTFSYLFRSPSWFSSGVLFWSDRPGIVFLVPNRNLVRYDNG
jgi:hypothetical protein